MSLIGLLTATEKQVPLGRLHMRPIQCHLKRHWRVPESLEKRDSSPKIPSPAPTMVDQGDQCFTRSTSAPLASCHSNLYRRLKRRLGCSLRRLYNKRCLVSAREPPSHKLPRTKSGLAGLKKIPAPSSRKGSANCYRQHHSCSIHQPGGRYEVRLTLCPSLAAPVLVQAETGCSKGQAHSWSSKCDCGQIVMPRPNHSDRIVQEVFNLLVHTWHLPLVDMFATKYNCELAQYMSPVLDPNAWALDTLTVNWENLDMHVFLRVITRQGSQQAIGPSLEESDPDRSWVAQHAMVLGSGGPVISDPSLPTQSSRPGDTTVQQGLSQGSDQPKPSRLAPRAKAIKEQEFSSPVASQIETPQRSSTRTIYEAKWAVFDRWCQTSQVDFRSPSMKHIADFLLHLFQEKNLQPSTIEGSRSAIADKLSNSSLNISKDENLTRLFDSFHRDRPKGQRGIPSWNLSMVLHQPTKPPFEPLRKASLKHLTFKTVFLLALGSGVQE